MGVLVLVLALLFALVTHEYAHYRAMTADGVRIVEAGLGMPLPPRLRIRRGKGGITWSLSPWLVGAYVLPDENDARRAAKTLPYTTLAWHFNAGVVVNIATGLAFMAASHVMRGELTFAAVEAGIAAGIAWRHRWWAACASPVLGVAALVFTAYALMLSWRAGDPGVGVVSLVESAPAAMTVDGGLRVFGAVALAVGVLNLVPIPPFDNGRVVKLLLDRWSPRVSAVVEMSGSALFLALVASSVAVDVWRLVKAVFD